MLKSLRCAMIAAVPVVLACASNTSEGGPRPNPGSSVITREELRQMDVRNLYEAIERLRPRWLLVRGGARSFSMETEVVVFQDQTYLGTQEVLERMGTEGVYSIRYMDGPTAKASLNGIGNRHVQGAIIISVRPDEPPDGSPGT